MGNEISDKFDMFNVLLCLLSFSDKVDAQSKNLLSRYTSLGYFARAGKWTALFEIWFYGHRNWNDLRIFNLKFVPMVILS